MPRRTCFVAAGQWFISSHGKDSPGCGTHATPCRSLPRLLNETGYNNFTNKGITISTDSDLVIDDALWVSNLVPCGSLTTDGSLAFPSKRELSSRTYLLCVQEVPCYFYGYNYSCQAEV